MVDPSPETKAIWDKLSGYQSWSKFPEQLTPTQSDSHMKMFVLSYYNDVVGQAEKDGVMPLPDGSIIVKDNFMKADDPMPMALTVMAKQGGEWYWIQAAPNGKVMVDDAGKPLEGKGVPMCVGCHSGWKDNDYVGTHKFGGGSGGAGGSAGAGGAGGSMPMAVDPSPETKAIWDKLSGYQSWPTFPNASTPKQSDSHMKMFVLSHHNEVVTQAIADKTLPLPDGSIIVKDNFMKADDPMPMALTVMAKQGGKWYWFEAMPDGKVMVDDAGKPLEGFDVPMCVGCHSGWKDNDYVGTYDFQP
jgi:hypothetical protein